ncbi:hypothetical protein PMAYCL1PPCAC_31097, partial [Pristionchus mayeri]
WNGAEDSTGPKKQQSKKKGRKRCVPAVLNVDDNLHLQDHDYYFLDDQEDWEKSLGFVTESDEEKEEKGGFEDGEEMLLERLDDAIPDVVEPPVADKE